MSPIQTRRAARALRIPLEHSGYDVEEAASAEEALSACRLGAPEVALIEHRFAQVNGRSLLDELKADPDAYTTAVVVVADDALGAARPPRTACAAAPTTC